MNYFRIIFNGLGIGSVIYLGLILVQGQATVVSAKDVLFLFSISFCIAIGTIVFKVEGLSYLSALVLHYLGVIILIILMNLIFGVNDSLIHLIIATTIIYIISYTVTMIKFFLVSRKFNRDLEKLKNKKHSQI
ncbi:DUF3021 family protein [Weissella bombi]|uniref:DUF3021 domain-containing protein n=1 Tax=Weissella bombi TaxID=1505725 RepID=A0A1C4B835_9LACO|nr:DUF3021 family protein [Weissella bombi]SCC03027.1 Protein of unknown function [Weissella bombi]